MQLCIACMVSTAWTVSSNPVMFLDSIPAGGVFVVWFGFVGAAKLCF